MTKKYDEYVPDDIHKLKEFDQETRISKEIINELEKTKSNLPKKYVIVIIISVIVIFAGGLYVYFLIDTFTPKPSGFSSNYLIQNLRGDVVQTWVSWKKLSDSLFHVHVLNSKYATQERLNAILDTIMSQQEIELDNSLMHKGPKDTFSTYYVGWYGALNSIDTTTKFNIVKNLHFHIDDDVSTGDIEIELTNLSSPDGYSGYTKSIVDEQNHQILKSTITIYNIDALSLEDIRTIVRHELGHGFGLAHSTAPEDLMAPVIATDYPYISECDLDAITHLYDGGESSQVVCEK